MWKNRWLRMLIVTLLLSISLETLATDVPPTGTQVKPITDVVTGMQLVFVKGGCYQMGSTEITGAKPVHKVCVNDFYIGKYEVTQSQWKKVMGSNPSRFKECGPDCPVEEVTWDDAQDFAKKLNNLSGKQYRLPTEAEWEYAARSGGKNEKWAGTSDESSLTRYAWYDKNSESSTHKVGLKKPNGLGVYDMNGNVWEWCQDWFNEDYYHDSPKDNPLGSSNGEQRVVRGGGVKNPFLAEVAVRSKMKPDFKEGRGSVGFRLALPAQ